MGGELSRDGARSIYGQGPMAKKKKFVGPNKLNFYFYLIFFNFLEKKKFLPNKFVF
jgi:hypothetical protein